MTTVGPVTTAVVFVPDHLFDQHAPECLAYCTACGYEIAGVIQGDWRAALAMLADGLATVIVVARRDHLPPDGGPRIEVASEHATPARAPDQHRDSARRRRPNRL